MDDASRARVNPWWFIDGVILIVLLVFVFPAVKEPEHSIFDHVKITWEWVVFGYILCTAHLLCVDVLRWLRGRD